MQLACWVAVPPLANLQAKKQLGKDLVAFLNLATNYSLQTCGAQLSNISISAVFLTGSLRRLH